MGKRFGKQSKVDSQTRADARVAHDRLRDEILVALSSAPVRLGMFWSNETGAAFRGEQLIKYGCKGSPDILGCVLGGYWIGLEVKTGNAVMNDNQRKFKPAVEAWGGRYFVVRSVGDALEAVRAVAFQESR